MSGDELLRFFESEEITMRTQIIQRIRERSRSKQVDARVLDEQMLEFEVLQPLRAGRSDEEFITFCGEIHDLELANRKRLLDLAERAEAAIFGRRPINNPPFSKFEFDWCLQVTRERHGKYRAEWLAHCDTIVNILEDKQ